MPHKKNCQCPPCRYRRGQDKGQTPQMSIRIAAEVREFLLAHQDGARAVIERLVQEEMRPSRRPSKRNADSDRWAQRVAELEAQLQETRSQLAQAGKSAESGKRLLSYKRRGKQLSGPGPMDLWGTRFAEALEGTRKAVPLLLRLGLDGLAGRWAIRQLGLGYCSPHAFRSEADRTELKKLGLIGTDERIRLAGCLTVPFVSPVGSVSGFVGIRIEGRGETQLVAGAGSGLLLTGAVEREVVIVDGVLEALAAYGAGLRSVQALDLLTPGWFPTLAQQGVETFRFLLADPGRARAVVRELHRLGKETSIATVPADLEARLYEMDNESSLLRLLGAHA